MRRLRDISDLAAVFGIALLPIATPVAALELEVVYGTLSFDRPVDLQHAGDGSGRLFVVEQAGLIKTIPADEADATASEPSVFLDIRDRVRRIGNEEGLLGLAFHPDFANNGFFFVNYTASSPRRTVIARFRAEGRQTGQVDADSERLVLEFPQPFSNHNGGQLAFGPDGYLYVASGDGGSGGDPQGHGQNMTTLLGKILRIDVDGESGELAYAIPADNPFVDGEEGAEEEAVREEVYALGLRNPWRISFDLPSGRLWAGDVGQNAFEEVDLIVSGGNYGWNVMEGNACFSPSTGCDSTRYEAPVWVYGRDEGVSVTGGYVYRGGRVPELFGAYVYADWGSGRIWALRLDSDDVASNTELLHTDLNISSFGVGDRQELYLLAFDGHIYRFKATTTPTAVVPSNPEGGLQGSRPDRFVLGQNFPNPFNGSTSIEYHLSSDGPTALAIFNLSGQKVRTLFTGYRSPGTHRAHWDGRDDEGNRLATGVYAYRMETPHHSESRKLILLR